MASAAGIVATRSTNQRSTGSGSFQRPRQQLGQIKGRISIPHKYQADIGLARVADLGLLGPGQEVISAASGAGLAAARVILDGGFPFFNSSPLHLQLPSVGTICPLCHVKPLKLGSLASLLMVRAPVESSTATYPFPMITKRCKRSSS